MVREVKKERKMETLMLEIRAGEGGVDSKMFIRDMAKMYSAYCSFLGALMECL